MFRFIEKVQEMSIRKKKIVTCHVRLVEKRKVKINNDNKYHNLDFVVKKKYVIFLEKNVLKYKNCCDF